MLVHVFHRKDLHQDPAETTPADLVWAAAVAVEDIRDVFRLTNSLDWHWSRNQNVIGAQTRSTSVGDIYLTDDGRAYQVDRMGLDLIDVPQLSFANDPIYQQTIKMIGVLLADWSDGLITRSVWADLYMKKAWDMANGLHQYTGIFDVDSHFFKLIALNHQLLEGCKQS
jgi:hypothetical protein